jgi:LysM repeat protein
MPTARPSATPAPTVEAYTGPTSYIVQPGDTLVSIAEALGIRADALAAENGITNVEIIHVGQELLLPNPAGTATPRPPSDTPPVPVNHVVQSGETLGSIARKYGISASSIARANQITSPDLVSVGMTLAIPSPAWTSPKLSGAVSRFVASISQQRCWLYQGNQVVADWPCSTGKPGTETHPGSYKIQSKLDRAYGSTWNIWMPYWLGIYWAGASENGIHGIPYDPEDNTKRLWEGLVGTPVTYGCVLLNDEHAKQLYDLAFIGMPVIVLP